MTWKFKAWHGIIGHSKARQGMSWYGKGKARHVKAWHGMYMYGMERHDMGWHGKERNDVEWHEKERHGMACQGMA
jgi:hypothetical protein